MAPVADQLAADVRELQAKVPTAEMSVASVGNGAKELLDEVATGKITGEEEAFSHTDLVDFQANLDGARKAYDVLRPLVADAELLASWTPPSPRSRTQLDVHRTATGFVSYETVDEAQRRELSRVVDGLGEPLSQLTRRPSGVSTTGGLSRRHLLVGAGALGAAGLAGAAAAAATGRRRRPGPAPVTFEGAHQAGIATPVQGHLHFASYDVTTTERAALVALLQDWTAAARDMTADRPVGGSDPGSRLAPPSDTGEAIGLDAANLTLTVGFGPSLVRRPVRAGGAATGRPGRPAGVPRGHAGPRHGATATWRSRPAPTTRRSRCTRCAT